MHNAKTDELLKDGKSLILAYDHGLEHGPADFNLDNVDPAYIIELAEKGRYNAIAVQAGIAEKYLLHASKKLPLIIKLNGKTNLWNAEPLSRQVCSVRRALKLGADALGYTIYLGSEHEPEMFAEFGKIIEEAHMYETPVIAWVYPRGRNVADPHSTSISAYAARAGLELGADFVKINYNGDLPGFCWAVRAAGLTKVLVAGGDHLSDREFLEKAHEVMLAGATGLTVGRNVWQHREPLKITAALRKIIFENKSVDEALKLLTQ